MGYAIELYFDPAFENKIKQLWDDLSNNGVPSILCKIGSRPHVSLAVLDSIDENQALKIVRNYIKGYSEFRITFPAIGLIPGARQTVFLAPEASSRLIEMQRTLHQKLKRAGLFPLDRYQPDKWLPHCTISKELSAPEALETIRICRNSPVTGTAKVTEIGIIEFRPRKEIKRFLLTGEKC